MHFVPYIAIAKNRSPHGERGLKCRVHDRTRVWPIALLMESVD